MKTELTEVEKNLINESGEHSTVRHNLLMEPNYTGYCGGATHKDSRCSMPRTKWMPDLGQFKCPHCGWVSQYPKNFIEYYRNKWSK